MSDKIDFTLKDIVGLDDESLCFIELRRKLENSVNHSKVFCLLAYYFLKLNKTYITVPILSDLLKMNSGYCYQILRDFVALKVLKKIKHRN